MANVIQAASPDRQAIIDAINLANEGDTVTVPAGTRVWTDTLVITKGIKLIGKTGTDSVTGVPNDQTIIQDGLTAAKPIIQLNTVAGSNYRISGFSFQPGPSSGGPNAHGQIQIFGLSHSVRLDHCHFVQNLHQPQHVQTQGAVWGVADHNIMRTPGAQCFNINHPAWPFGDGSAGNSTGDGSWNSPTNFGSEEFWFIEDNFLYNDTRDDAVAGAESGENTDGTFGGRFVFRHNHCYDTQVLNHGTFGGAQRGIRAVEVYSNDFHYKKARPAGGCTGGTQLWHDNTWDKGGNGIDANGTVPPTFLLSPQYYRVFQGTPNWQAMSGECAWDVNYVPGTIQVFNNSRNPLNLPDLGLYNYTVAADGEYESGTTGAGTSVITAKTAALGNGTIVDTTKNWKQNQWINFPVERTSNRTISMISANTSTQLTIKGYPDGSSQAFWVPGDHYRIGRPLIGIDAPGRGIGDKVIRSGTPAQPLNLDRGSTGSNSVQGSAYPRNEREPLRAWNNKYYPDSGAHNTTPTEIRIISDVGSSQEPHITGGTGSDTNVDYVNDDTGHLGSSNSWSGPSYQEFTYPHPLTQDSNPPPPPTFQSVLWTK